MGVAPLGGGTRPRLNRAPRRSPLAWSSEAVMTVTAAGRPASTSRLPEAISSTTDPSERVRVEGRFLARRGERLRVQGVTYGPFPPDADRHQFPTRERVADDF